VANTCIVSATKSDALLFSGDACGGFLQLKAVFLDVVEFISTSHPSSDGACDVITFVLVPMSFSLSLHHGVILQKFKLAL
jgi:hypothetical protein